MSTQPPTDAELFFAFLRDQLADGANDRAPEEFVDLWRAQHGETDSAIDAVREGVEDMQAGRVFPFDEVNDEIRRRHGWSSPQ